MADEPPGNWSFTHRTTETVARAPKMIEDLSDVEIDKGAKEFAAAVKRARDNRKEQAVR